MGHRCEHLGLDDGILCVDLGLLLRLVFLVLGCNCYYEHRDGVFFVLTDLFGAVVVSLRDHVPG